MFGLSTRAKSSSCSSPFDFSAISFAGHCNQNAAAVVAAVLQAELEVLNLFFLGGWERAVAVAKVVWRLTGSTGGAGDVTGVKGVYEQDGAREGKRLEKVKNDLSEELGSGSVVLGCGRNLPFSACARSERQWLGADLVRPSSGRADRLRTTVNAAKAKRSVLDYG
ncbi:hypothetical protein B0H17DRAFT_1139553 [Mycena rosella]|uniref:Uncharacterized protein n=1 Tax=Mycena rosella TaxID=1033263 RepID=A0AAD7GCC1_MYCRO|nr:hypothetical protein B0H17DRAFT_1139553 [Mycena rosella]